MFIYIDGKFLDREEARISVFDHGLLYGDGVFEGIRAYNGRVFRLEDHINRLYDSAHVIDLAIPLTKDQMRTQIIETLRRNKLHDAYIRPLVTRGIGDLSLDPRTCTKPSVIIIAMELEPAYGDLYEKGLSAVTVSVRRNDPAALPPNAKSLNYLNNILAKIEAIHKGGDEAIMFDPQGKLSEGSGDNVCIVREGTVYIPQPINNLRGITRKVLLSICGESDIPVEKEDIGYFELYTADEVFLSGTGAEIAPVVRIDGRAIGSGKPGPVTRHLIESFRKIAESEGTPIY